MSEKTQSDKAAAAPKWSLLESAIWSPAKAGDNVTGALGPSETGPFGEQHTLLTDGVPSTVVLPHLAALGDLSRVQLGTMVRITYTGNKVSAAGNTYKAFTIETATSSGGGAA